MCDGTAPPTHHQQSDEYQQADEPTSHGQWNQEQHGQPGHGLAAKSGRSLRNALA